MLAPDLLKDKPSKLFFQYLIPSMSSTLITSLYILADTIMIGKGVGAKGLAALNLLLPVTATFFAIGLMFGVGGGVLMSVANGRGNRTLANAYFTGSVIASISIGIILTMVCSFKFDQLAYILGSTNENLEMVRDYGHYIVWFCPCFIGSTLLQSLIRNDKAPKKAMFGVLTGAVINVILDYLFIFWFDWGMEGGAVATVIGTSGTVLILLTHFGSKNNGMKLCIGGFSIKRIKEIIVCGISSFLIEAASGVVVFFFNLQILKYIGEIGVVVYGIVSNSSIIAMSLFNGTAQAAQPIMASNYGAGQFTRVRSVRKIGALAAGLIGLILFLLGTFYPAEIISIFINPTADIMPLGVGVIKIYFTAFLVMCFNIFYSSYFQATVKPKVSFIICLLRGLILSTGLLYLLPPIFGAHVIWRVVPITELITFLLTAILVNYDNNKSDM